jgi:HTH-type transcriptional regulator, cell division transcriptional repressor
VRQYPHKKNISGKRIAEARSASKPPLTQEDHSARLSLADVQMDRAAVAKIESNLRRVLDFELKAIAKALDVEVDWLLGGED